MRKLGMVILVLSIISTLRGISSVYYGIAEKGFHGVNYGEIICPICVLLLGVYILKRDRLNNDLADE